LRRTTTLTRGSGSRSSSRPTEVGVWSDRELGQQCLTRAHEPALRVLDAWNAEENTHMRAVKAMLGFQPVDGWSVFQLSVPAR
jgi:hypothetical protein